MDFGIGYRWRSHESNLLLAVRLAPNETPPAETATSSAETTEPPPAKPHTKKPRPPALVEPYQQRNGFFWFFR
jgi:hypothetical protein